MGELVCGEGLVGLSVAALAGAAVGFATSALLWWTARRLPVSAHPTHLALATALARAVLTIAAFVVVAQGSLLRALAWAAGFLAARARMTLAMRDAEGDARRA